MLGSGAMTNSIDDVCRKSDVVMLVGSNPEEAHPVIGMQLRAAVERGDETVDALLLQNGKEKAVKLHLTNMTQEERDIVLAGCLINYYAK